MLLRTQSQLDLLLHTTTTECTVPCPRITGTSAPPGIITLSTHAYQGRVFGPCVCLCACESGIRVSECHVSGCQCVSVSSCVRCQCVSVSCVRVSGVSVSCQGVMHVSGCQCVMIRVRVSGVSVSACHVSGCQYVSVSPQGVSVNGFVFVYQCCVNVSVYKCPVHDRISVGQCVSIQPLGVIFSFRVIKTS